MHSPYLQSASDVDCFSLAMFVVFCVSFESIIDNRKRPSGWLDVAFDECEVVCFEVHKKEQSQKKILFSRLDVCYI